MTDAAFPLYDREPHALTDDKTLVASSEMDWSSSLNSDHLPLLSTEDWIKTEAKARRKGEMSRDGVKTGKQGRKQH